MLWREYRKKPLFHCIHEDIPKAEGDSTVVSAVSRLPLLADSQREGIKQVGLNNTQLFAQR